MVINVHNRRRNVNFLCMKHTESAHTRLVFYAFLENCALYKVTQRLFIGGIQNVLAVWHIHHFHGHFSTLSWISHFVTTISLLQPLLRISLAQLAQVFTCQIRFTSLMILTPSCHGLQLLLTFVQCWKACVKFSILVSKVNVWTTHFKISNQPVIPTAELMRSQSIEPKQTK